MRAFIPPGVSAALFLRPQDFTNFAMSSPVFHFSITAQAEICPLLRINIKKGIILHYVELYTFSTRFSTPAAAFIFNIFFCFWEKLTGPQPAISHRLKFPLFVNIILFSAYIHNFSAFPYILRFHNTDFMVLLQHPLKNCRGAVLTTPLPHPQISKFA